MKEWWMNLPLHEKRALFLGSVIVILFILYEMIWSPLSDTNDNLRMRIGHGQDTLRSMQQTDELISHLQKNALQKKQQTTQSILGTVQDEVNDSPFAKHVNQLRQSDNQTVQMSLNQVDFDGLLVFLMKLWKSHAIIVSQITVTPAGSPGEVNVDVVLAGA
ncbi:MAG TPA: type II secretion system protein GspM [Gammaproteobacteria bacterium]|nr:type II secretion system protein GspM [Gammaproteobacteria bacterium]